MFFAGGPRWSEVASTAIAIAGFLVAVGVIVRVFRRPVSWVGQQLVGEPLGRWFRDQIREVMAPAVETIQRELRFDHGESVKDHVKQTAVQVQRLSEQVDAIVAKPGGNRRTDPPKEDA